jgi:hypothetical protein
LPEKVDSKITMAPPMEAPPERVNENETLP